MSNEHSQNALPPRDVSLRLRFQPRTVLIVAVLVAAFARFAGLGAPPKMIFDEIYYARTAREYLAGAPLYEWTHPPLSKLLVAAGVRAFGFEPWGWRFAPALAGVLLIPAMFALGTQLFRDERMGALAAALTSLDSMLLVESRIAKPEAFLVLFIASAYAGWWTSLRTGRVATLYVAGALGGAALATKWTGGAALAVLAVTSVVAWRRGELPWPTRHLLAALVFLPIIVYAATYAPHFVRGESLREVLRLHAQMFHYHSKLVAEHPYASAWWTWPLLLRPMWYHYEANQGIMTGVFAVGNPALWWATVPAMLRVAVRALGRRNTPDIFLVLAFSLVYLPYAFIGRLLFVYHMVPALIPAFLAIADGLRAASRRFGPGGPLAYLTAAAAIFVFQSPVLAAIPVPQTWLRWWTWMRTWV